MKSHLPKSPQNLAHFISVLWMHYWVLGHMGDHRWVTNVSSSALLTYSTVVLIASRTGQNVFSSVYLTYLKWKKKKSFSCIYSQKKSVGLERSKGNEKTPALSWTEAQPAGSPQRMISWVTFDCFLLGGWLYGWSKGVKLQKTGSHASDSFCSQIFCLREIHLLPTPYKKDGITPFGDFYSSC